MNNRQQRKDLLRRHMVDVYGARRRLLKLRIRDVRTSESERQRAQQELGKRPRDASPTRVCNRCVETGRGRAVMRVYRRSRFVIRSMALQGKLPGVSKR